MKYKFFFYGTLSHEMANPVSKTIHRKLKGGEAAHVIGRLFAIPHSEGYYPALVLGDTGYRVSGYLYEANKDFSFKDLEMLDEYEEFYPDDVDGSEYVRRAVWVTLGHSYGVTCDAYVYNGELPADADEIPSGEFASFMKEHGFQAFGDGT